MVTATGPIDAATSDPISVRRGVVGMVTAAVRITIAVQDGRPRPSAAPSICESSISVRKKAFSITSQMPAFALVCGSEPANRRKTNTPTITAAPAVSSCTPLPGQLDANKDRQDERVHRQRKRPDERADARRTAQSAGPDPEAI